MKIPAHLKPEIERTCDSLWFVRWDRFVQWKNGIGMYGWIDREDAYKDFFVIYFYFDGSEAEYNTSSALYSLDAFKILNDGYGRGHRKCRRAEHYFNLERSIKLAVTNDRKAR